MKVFVAFDARFNPQTIGKLCCQHQATEVILFPLSNDYKFNNQLEQSLSESYDIKLVNSADKINQTMSNLRKDIIDWSYELGEQEIRRKKVKDWLLLPGTNLSAWWLSLLSGKNTVATNAFFQMAQIKAIESLFSEGSYDLFVTALSDKSLTKSLKIAANNFKIPMRQMHTTHPNKNKSLKSQIRQLLRQKCFFGNLLLGFVNLITEFHKAHKIKKSLGNKDKRIPEKTSLCFVGWFPAIDEKAAKNGILKNKYTTALQDFLNKENVPVTWLMTPISIDGHSFNDSLELAKQFINHGEKLFFIQEFFTLKGFLRSILIWLRQIFVSIFLLHSLKKKKLYTKKIGPAFYPIIKSLWHFSFVDAIGTTGIMQSEMFKTFFKTTKNIKDCLYYFEMNSWGKAFCAAKNQIKPGIRIIGFMHAAISKNHLHYFFHPEEMRPRNKLTDLPLPDIIATNGSLMQETLSPYYPSLTPLESMRYLSISKILSKSIPKRTGKPILVIASSGDTTGLDEAKSMIWMIHNAFPRTDQFEIWFKPHPTINIHQIFANLKIDYQKCGYQITEKNMSDLLPKAQAVMVGSSTVAIEALAYGCEIIVPIFANVLSMSPLMDFHDYCYRITSSEELLATWEKIRKGDLLKTTEQKHAFIKRYWWLDPELPKWHELFKNRF